MIVIFPQKVVIRLDEVTKLQCVSSVSRKVFAENRNKRMILVVVLSKHQIIKLLSVMLHGTLVRVSFGTLLLHFNE